MGERRTVVWFSCGAASAVAAMLTVRNTPDAVLAYCETGAEHPDNERFLSDIERWCERPVERLRSERYASTWDVWERRRYLAGNEGAPCTTELKIAPRIAWQMPTDIHVFGYTADLKDMTRAKNLRANWFELDIRTPLIDRGIPKEACIALLERLRIAPPVMYSLGFQNNNCIPCVKATSPNYWANVRLHFPDEFYRLAGMARELGVRLARIDDVRIFIDDIPHDWPTIDAIAPSCDFLCHIAEQDLQNAAVN
jgi:hypothetical protein